MARYGRPAKLDPALYETWLKENPKPIVGGPIQLELIEGATDQDDVFFPSRRVNTTILPEHYAEKLSISSESDEFSGFKIHVGPKDYDFLLAAHQHHYNGTFMNTDGKLHGNDPHFQEWDFSVPKRKKGFAKRFKCPPILFNGMAPHELLDVFLDHYYFDDGRTSPTKPPTRPRVRQGKITNVE